MRESRLSPKLFLISCATLLTLIQVVCAEDNLSDVRWRLGTTDGNTQESHEGGIYQVAWSRDGKWIATRGSDRTVRIWANGKPKSVLKHKSSVGWMTFSWDSRLLLTNSSHGSSQLWDPASGEIAYTLTSKMERARFRPNSKMLVSIYRDKIQAIDFQKDQRLREVSGPSYAMDFSPDGTLLAAIPRFGDYTIRLHDTNTGNQIRSLEGSEGYPMGLTFSPNGHILASGGRDERVRCWEVATGKELFVLAGHDGPVQSVAFSTDGKWLASGGWDHKVRVWNIATAKQISVFSGHNDIVTSLAFSPDGRWLVSGSLDQTAVVWTLPKRAESVQELDRRELERLWELLQSPDPQTAYEALGALRQQPKSTLAFLSGKLRTHAVPHTQDHILEVVAELDAEEFEIRERATQLLLSLRAKIDSLLKELLTSGELSLEQQTRIQRVLRSRMLPPVSDQEQRQFIRTISLLEQIGTDKATALLSVLETEIPSNPVNEAAAAALARMQALQ